jgi:hypothetical protein
MARPRRSGKARRKPARAERTPNLGSHWRADGAPKTGYRNQGEALSVADERRQDTGIDLNVYQCEYCSAWHMGNSEPRRRT